MDFLSHPTMKLKELLRKLREIQHSNKTMQESNERVEEPSNPYRESIWGLGDMLKYSVFKPL